MFFVTSLSVQRMNDRHHWFWPQVSERLVVVVFEPQPRSETLFAFGVTGSRGHEHVVEAEILREQLSSFLKAVIDANVAESDCRNTTQHEIAALEATREPRLLAARAAVALARAIRAEEQLADAVVANPERREPPDCR
jgi:hypothetical protein